MTNILASVQQVDTKVKEIASASNEQAQGMSEIGKAMGQLDIVTQQNSTIAQKSATASVQLNGYAKDLRTMVGDLVGLLDGVLVQETHESPAPTGVTVREPRKSGPVEHVPSGNVVALPVKTKSVGKVTLKKAVGQNGAMPSADDPRFEEF